MKFMIIIKILFIYLACVDIAYSRTRKEDIDLQLAEGGDPGNGQKQKKHKRKRSDVEDMSPGNDALVDKHSRKKSKNANKGLIKAQNQAVQEWFRLLSDTNPTDWTTKFTDFHALFHFYVNSLSTEFNSKNFPINVVSIKSSTSTVDEDKGLLELFLTNSHWDMIFVTTGSDVNKEISSALRNETVSKRGHTVTTTEISSTCSINMKIACMNGQELVQHWSRISGDASVARPGKRSKSGKRIHILRVHGEGSGLEMIRSFLSDEVTKRELPLMIAFDFLSSSSSKTATGTGTGTGTTTGSGVGKSQGSMPDSTAMATAKTFLEDKGYIVSDNFFPLGFALLKRTPKRRKSEE
eukprot:gene4790-9548_t